MLRVTREVQAGISKGENGGATHLQPASHDLLTLEAKSKHNDRCACTCDAGATGYIPCSCSLPQSCHVPLSCEQIMLPPAAKTSMQPLFSKKFCSVRDTSMRPVCNTLLVAYPPTACRMAEDGCGSHALTCITCAHARLKMKLQFSLLLM